MESFCDMTGTLFIYRGRVSKKDDLGSECLVSNTAVLLSLFTIEKLTAGVTQGPLRLAHGLGNTLEITSTCKYYQIKKRQPDRFLKLTVSAGRI
jgi:hypothetical protein